MNLMLCECEQDDGMANEFLCFIGLAGWQIENQNRTRRRRIHIEIRYLINGS